MAVVNTRAQTIRPGATIEGDAVTFRVWAPERSRVALVLLDSEGKELKSVSLEREDEGYFSGSFGDVAVGALYALRLDDERHKYPDPASNFQPQGVFGPSQVVDHRQFSWSDAGWGGVSMRGQVFYELHIGTFTPQGTWRAAAEKLPELREVGVTVVQVMPVAAFPGQFGWGYDGVYWYAPTQLYGTPDEFRAFVDRAHSLNIGVTLDVVYNHFGPAGNFAGQFSPYYESRKHQTEWGGAVNYDGENCGPVRDFVAENAAYWVREFHLDGLRLDATQSIADDSAEHIVAQLTRAARQAAGKRSIVVVSEDERNRCQQVLDPDDGGWGVDGLFNDDYHHSCRVAATGMNEAYYRDYTGSPQELVSLIRLGHLYQGQWHLRRGHTRGEPTRKLPAHHFIHFLQNHDQVANSARGLRTHLLTSPGRHRALTALTLLGPETPFLFMGQEFGASNPFYYFADHEPELAELVRAGRRDFMHQFPRIKAWKDADDLSHPTDQQTFAACKLNWDERAANGHIVRLHRDLTELRKSDETFARQDRQAIEGAVIGPEAFALRWYDEADDDRLLLVNLGRDFEWHPVSEPIMAAPPGHEWQLLWSSEDGRYGGMGTPLFDGKNWPVPGHAAVVFRAVNV